MTCKKEKVTTGKKEFVDYDKVGKTKFVPPKTALDKKLPEANLDSTW